MIGLLLTNAELPLTDDPTANAVANAVAIAGGKIAAVGEGEDPRRSAKTWTGQRMRTSGSDTE